MGWPSVQPSLRVGFLEQKNGRDDGNPGVGRAHALCPLLGLRGVSGCAEAGGRGYRVISPVLCVLGVSLGSGCCARFPSVTRCRDGLLHSIPRRTTGTSCFHAEVRAVRSVLFGVSQGNPLLFLIFYFVLGYSRLTVSEGAQPYIHMYPFFPKLPSRLPHNIKHSSLCWTVGPCWLSILNRQCVHVHPKLPNCPFPTSLPLATISLFSTSVSLFVLSVSSSVSFFLDFTIRDVLRYFSREPLLVLCFVMSGPLMEGKEPLGLLPCTSTSLNCCIVFL